MEILVKNKKMIRNRNLVKNKKFGQKSKFVQNKNVGQTKFFIGQKMGEKGFRVKYVERENSDWLSSNDQSGCPAHAHGWESKINGGNKWIPADRKINKQNTVKCIQNYGKKIVWKNIFLGKLFF